MIRCTASLVVTNNGPEGTHILQIYWIKKDAIKCLDGRSVLDKPFFKMNLKYKECFISWCMLVTYPLDHSERIDSPSKSNFRFIVKPKQFSNLTKFKLFFFLLGIVTS